MLFFSPRAHSYWTQTYMLSLSDQEKKIFFVSCIISLALFLFTNPIVFGLDTHAYFRFAESIIRFDIAPGVYARRAGYPWLLVLTLYPWTQSVIPILALQTICAALTPLIIYRTLYFVSPNTSKVVTWVSIFTLLPFSFQTYIFPDPMQLFFSLLLCYFTVAYLFNKTTKLMVCMFITYLVLSFYRPTYLLFYLIPFCAAAIIALKNKSIRVEHLKYLFVMTWLCLNVHLVVDVVESDLYQAHGISKPQMHGRMLFLNAFTRSNGIKGAFTDGRYTNELRQGLASYFRDAPLEKRDINRIISSKSVQQYLLPYQNNPDGMAEAILNMRSNYIWSRILFDFAQLQFGDYGDHLFMLVALEQYRMHPEIIKNVFSAGLGNYFGFKICNAPEGSSAQEFACIFTPSVYPDVLYNFGNGDINGMRPYTSHWIGSAAFNAIVSPFRYAAIQYWPYIYKTIFPLSSILTLIGCVLIFISSIFRVGTQAIKRDIPAFCVIFGSFLLYSLPMMILTDPEFRYVSPAVLLMIMSGGISLHMLIKQLSILILKFRNAS